MKITALVENHSSCELKAKHGLSLYIETPAHKILFDLGPDNTLFENAAKRNVDLTAVDTVIISHGHLDHGGALGRFLEINKTATVYVQRHAFEKHYTKVLGLRFPCGIKEEFASHPQVQLLDGNFEIDRELYLFTVEDKSRCYSSMNDSLYTGKEKDTFDHEQHLIIRGDENVLIMGCGHAGVVNIMAAAEQWNPVLCIGGYHLMNPNSKKTVPEPVLDEIAAVLKGYDHTRFYTCHCTGETAYNYLSARVPNLGYLSCGESVEL